MSSPDVGFPLAPSFDVYAIASTTPGPGAPLVGQPGPGSSQLAPVSSAPAAAQDMTPWLIAGGVLLLLLASRRH